MTTMRVRLSVVAAVTAGARKNLEAGFTTLRDASGKLKGCQAVNRERTGTPRRHPPEHPTFTAV
jgi:hypothetical protein